MIIFINVFFAIIGLSILKWRLKSYNSYVNHLAIFGFIWLFITLFSQVFYPNLVDFGTTIIFFGAWYSYIIGSSIINHKKNVRDKFVYLNSGYLIRLKIVAYVLIILCVIANYDLLQKVIFNFSSLAAWASLRKENEFETIDESSIFKALFQRSYLIYIPILILLFRNKKINWLILTIAIISGLVISTLRFTRAPFLQLMITILVSYIYIYKKRLPIKTILIGVFSVFLIFVVSSFFLLGQGGSTERVFDEIRLYLFGGQVAYQDILEHKYLDNYKYDIKVYTLDFLNYILKKIGVIEKYPSYVREWYRPLTTNTYTYLDSYTLDLGVLGAILGSFFTGLFSDYSYYILNKKQNVFSLVFYGYICYFNAFVFANNEFIRFSVLLTFVTLWVLNSITKKKKYV